MHLRRHALMLDPHLASAALGLPDDPTDPAAGGGDPAPAPDGAKPDEPLGEGGKAALEAERRARTEAERARRAAETELQKLKDKDLSESERKDREAKDALSRAERAEADLARIRAALAEGLDPDLADRLRGTTPEELAEDAKVLKAKFGAAATPPAGDAPKTPRLVPDRGQGAKPAGFAGGFEAGRARARQKYATPGGDAA